MCHLLSIKMEIWNVFDRSTIRSLDTSTCLLKTIPIICLLVSGVGWSTAQDNCIEQLAAKNVGLTGRLSIDLICGCSSVHVTKSMDTTTLKDVDTHHVKCNDCPSWIEVGNSTYMIPEGRRNFEDSRELCQDCGGDIAVLNATDIRETIEVIMDEIGDGKSSIWIGILRVQPERVLFEWLDGRNFSVTDSSWDNNQPNDSPGVQDCVASFSKNSWELEDKQCTDEYYALCQRESVS